MNQVHANRLLRVAQALRESEHPEDFDMGTYGNPCGTPACAIGHYASRRDLQKSFRLVVEEGGSGTVTLHTNTMRAYFDDQVVLDHFGITFAECIELFSMGGCGEASTPKRAASYIEHFVQRKGFLLEVVE